MQADLISINHAKPDHSVPIVGGIVCEFVCGQDDDGSLAPGWCDMRAPYHIWKYRDDPDVPWSISLYYRLPWLSETHQLSRSI